jgi:hypothetical protein
VATVISGWYMGELQEQLEERLRCLDPVSFKVARDFIEGWKALIGEWQDAGFPKGHFWHAHVANHPEGAALLGVTVDPLEHRPYTEIACLAPCVICDMESAREEESREQPLQGQSSSDGGGCEELSQGSVGHHGEGGGPPKGGNGEASAEERQRVRDKGKAKVQVSWCRWWLDKAKSSECKKEEREREERSLREFEELQRRDQLKKKLEHRFDQQEEALGSKRQLRKKEEKKVAGIREQWRKEVEKNPRLGKLLEHVRGFINGWLRYIEVHKGVPEAKLWLAYAANDPIGAECYGATVDPAEHLPQVVKGCLTPCRLCDQVQPLETRMSVWFKTQQLWKQAKKNKAERERTAATEAAEAKATVAQKRQDRKAEARERRKTEETPQSGAAEADAGGGAQQVGELFGRDERQLRAVLRAVEA